MVEVPPIEEVVKDWESGARARASKYAERAKAKARKWFEETKAAEKRWAEAIQDAIRRGAFLAGVEEAGEAKYKDGIDKKGESRYPTGIAAATDIYKKAMKEVLDIIAGVELSERGPRGDPRNYERVKAIGEALHNWRIAKKSKR